MSVASFSGGHAEGAYTIHLRFLHWISKQTRCFTSTILQSSRAQLIVLALFWELDSSRGASSRPCMPPLVSGPTCVSVFPRLTGGVLILRRVCARTIQTSANRPVERATGALGIFTRSTTAGDAEKDRRASRAGCHYELAEAAPSAGLSLPHSP